MGWFFHFLDASRAGLAASEASREQKERDDLWLVEVRLEGCIEGRTRRS